MREVEIKVRLASVKSFILKLDEKGIKLGEPKKQHDVVFSEPGAVENHFKANWLRIRTENDSVVYFTLKKSVEGHLDNIEHEVTVNESAELKNIILCLGYEPYSDLTKVRRKVKINDIEICLDEVPGLGNFVEAEKLVDHDSDHDSVVSELWQLLTSLGLSRENEVHEGYDVLERKNRGL